MNFWTQSKDNIWVAAHRGFSSDYPENTMSAFKAALDEGVDQIETDVRVTKDGELVLIHDSKVDRTTDGTGKVNSFTLAELKKLDAGIKKGEQFKGERVPTFIEFMELVKDHPTITLDIELKERPDEVDREVAFDVCDKVIQIVEDYGFADRVVLNTFSGELHEYINDKYGKKYKQHVYFPVKYLGKLTRNPYDYAYCCCMFKTFYSDVNMADKYDFEKMQSLGVEAWAGACVKDEKTVDMAIERGATLITCNNVDTVLNLLRQKGKHK